MALNKEVSNSHSNWFGEVKHKFNTWYANLDASSYKIVEALTYAGVGFFIGFFLKKYAREVILCTVVLFVTLFLFDNFKLITFDWHKIRELTGISTSETVGSLFKDYYDWLRSHIVLMVSAFVGFLLGYKLG